MSVWAWTLPTFCEWSDTKVPSSGSQEEHSAALCASCPGSRPLSWGVEGDCSASTQGENPTAASSSAVPLAASPGNLRVVGEQLSACVAS